MRLLVLALTTLAFAQPVHAREHYRQHHLMYGAHAYHHLARTQTRHHARRSTAWGGENRPMQRYAVVDRDRGWNESTWDRGRSFAQGNDGHGRLDAMISRHAQQNGLPEALVHRVVIRESRYQPGVVGAGGAMGLMQIKLATAREMGYAGTAAGLLDPETNLTYAVRYLAGAYRVAGGNADRAVANYARGYRDTAVRQGAASRMWVASSENSQWSNTNSQWSNGNSQWSNSYASAAPGEQVAWVRAPVRYRPHRQVVRPH